MRVGIAAAGLPAPEATVEAVPAAPAQARVIPRAAVPAQGVPLPKPRPVVPVPAPATARTASPAPSLAVSDCAAPDDPVIAPQPQSAEHVADSKILILTSSYSLDLDIVAECPLTTGPIRSRGGSASLVDRLYFATRDIKRSWRRPRAPAEQPLPRKITVTRGLSQLAAG
jgi:hypothetical protein